MNRLRAILTTEKKLSSREAEVTELIAKGLSNREVGNQLFVTEKTIKWHFENIKKKLGVTSRAQVIVWCLPYLQFTSDELTAKAKPDDFRPIGSTTDA